MKKADRVPVVLVIWLLVCVALLCVVVLVPEEVIGPVIREIVEAFR